MFAQVKNGEALAAPHVDSVKLDKYERGEFCPASMHRSVKAQLASRTDSNRNHKHGHNILSLIHI